jgi:hypothetical protein
MSQVPTVETPVKSVTLTGPYSYVKEFLILADDLRGIPYRDACDLLAENGFTFSHFESATNEAEFSLTIRNQFVVTAKLEFSSENS